MIIASWPSCQDSHGSDDFLLMESSLDSALSQNVANHFSLDCLCWFGTTLQKIHPLLRARWNTFGGMATSSPRDGALPQSILEIGGPDKQSLRSILPVAQPFLSTFT